MILLPLIILAAANPCPYCKWDACSFTLGSLPTAPPATTSLHWFLSKYLTHPSIPPFGTLGCASCVQITVRLVPML